MAQLKIGGKRKEVEGQVSTSASAFGEENGYSRFSITLREEGEFGKSDSRYHRLALSRTEAEYVVRAFQDSLGVTLDKFGLPIRNR
jgi:hypothetical protein